MIRRKRAGQWARYQRGAVRTVALEVALAAKRARCRCAHGEVAGEAAVGGTTATKVRLIREKNGIAAGKGRSSRVGLRNHHPDCVAVRHRRGRIVSLEQQGASGSAGVVRVEQVEVGIGQVNVIDLARGSGKSAARAARDGVCGTGDGGCRPNRRCWSSSIGNVEIHDPAGNVSVSVGGKLARGSA